MGRAKKSNISDAELLAYLEGALNSECGIEVQTHHLDYLRRRFHALRRKYADAGDDRFKVVKISTSPHKRGCIWLMKEKSDEGD